MQQLEALRDRWMEGMGTEGNATETTEEDVKVDDETEVGSEKDDGLKRCVKMKK